MADDENDIVDVIGVGEGNEGNVSIHYEAGDEPEQEEYQPTPKRRKSQLLKEINLSRPANRRPWKESKTYGEFYDCVLDNNGELTNFVVCRKCQPPKTPATFNYTGTHNLRCSALGFLEKFWC